MQSLKIFSLNIECDLHYERILPFLDLNKPDVLCLQEFFESDIKVFQTDYPHVIFAPLAIFEKESDTRFPGKGKLGVAIFSKFPLTSTQKNYYVGSEEKINVYIQGHPNLFNRAIVSADIEIEGKIYRVATTHFTWTPEGNVTEEQQRDLTGLLKIVDKIEPLILCGDFNAPRGKEIFDTLATRLKDNIPTKIKTSIDQKLHRVPGLQLMVDGFFTSQAFEVTEIKMVEGVSDHQGILATVHSSLESKNV